MMSAASAVKKIRRNLGLDVSEFGELLGVTRGAINNWESGNRKPKMRYVRKMRDIAQKNKIEFSMDEFFEE